VHNGINQHEDPHYRDRPIRVFREFAHMMVDFGQATDETPIFRPVWSGNLREWPIGSTIPTRAGTFHLEPRPLVTQDSPDFRNLKRKLLTLMRETMIQSRYPTRLSTPRSAQ